MKKIKILLVGLLVVLIAITYILLNQVPKDIAGTYQTHPLRFYELPFAYLGGITTHTINEQVILKTDSTFIHTTCGNRILGNWAVENDTLLLKNLIRPKTNFNKL